MNVEKVLCRRLFKNHGGKAQKKAQGRSVFSIRKDLSFLKQRSQRGFFNSLVDD